MMESAITAVGKTLIFEFQNYFSTVIHNNAFPYLDFENITIYSISDVEINFGRAFNVLQTTKYMFFDSLNINKVYSSPLAEGYGEINCCHGILPIPVPAVCSLAYGVK